jgi:Protein of unknown function (DUF1552)
MDQVAAESLHGQKRFASLPLACEGFGLAWTRSGAPVPVESWPSSVFAKLFIEGRPEEVEEQKRRLQNGRSILDAVGEQARDARSAENQDQLDHGVKLAPCCRARRRSGGLSGAQVFAATRLNQPGTTTTACFADLRSGGKALLLPRREILRLPDAPARGGVLRSPAFPACMWG